jgi:hypothetical protein
VTLERDGRRVRLVAADGQLAGLPLTCAAVAAASGDEVAAFDLAPSGAASPAPAVPPGGTPSPAAGAGGGYRFTLRSLATRRQGRRVDITVRAVVCGAPDLIDVRARFALRRRGHARFAPARSVPFLRWQRARCQQHRLVWRIRTATGRRYDVRAAFSAAGWAERRAGAPPVPAPSAR